MTATWTDILVRAAMAAAFIVISFFSFRSIITFGRTLKQNRAAGMYDDPEFKRRIRPLNIMRYGVIGVELLSLVPGIWALVAGVPRETVATVWFAFLVPVGIWSIVVDHRWHKLMTKGVPKDHASPT